MVTGDGWKPESVQICDKDLVYIFEVNKWLSTVDGDCKTTLLLKPNHLKRQVQKVNYCLTLISECLPDNDSALTPFIRLAGADGAWRVKQQLSGTGNFRPGKPGKFRFTGVDLGEVSRIQVGIDNVQQLESVYNNAQGNVLVMNHSNLHTSDKTLKVPACWIISKIFLQVVDFDKDNKPHCRSQYSVSDRLVFSDKHLVWTKQPDSATIKMKSLWTKIVIRTSQPLK